MTPRLPIIPVVDVRDGGTLRHARESSDRARSLRDACVAWFPGAARPLVPVLDGIARRWLTRSQSPYVEEIRAIAAALGFPGIWFLNGSYQWSCTALAREEDGAPWLARTLDWPFPGLGRFVELVRMRGPAGEFVNVTWPGYVGVADRARAGAFRRRHQPGADAQAHRFPPAAALRPCRQRRGDAAPPARHSAGPVAPPGVRAGARLRRSAAHAGNHTGGAAGDLHAGRLPRGRALRDRAHRGWLQHAHGRPRRGQRLAGEHAAMGGPHRREQGVHLRRSRTQRWRAAPAAKGSRCGAARSRATASAGSRRRCSIPTRGLRSR